MFAVAVRRGCGTRVANGVYFELGIDEEGNGVPIETYLIDPPVPVAARAREMFGISPRTIGRYTNEDTGKTLLFDWVGVDSYPFWPDFVEEGKRFGISRRMSSKADFSFVKETTRLVLCHPRGFLKNWMAHELLNGRRIETQQMMQRQLYDAIAPGPDDVLSLDLSIERVRPNLRYNATRIMPNFKPEWQLAMVASFPIGRLAVVKGDLANTIADAIRSQTDALVEIVEA